MKIGNYRDLTRDKISKNNAYEISKYQRSLKLIYLMSQKLTLIIIKIYYQ